MSLSKSVQRAEGITQRLQPTVQGSAREEAPPAEAMPGMPPALKRFEFLAAKMSQPQSSSSNAMASTLSTPRSVSVAETTRSQLVQYFAELQTGSTTPYLLLVSRARPLTLRRLLVVLRTRFISGRRTVT